MKHPVNGAFRNDLVSFAIVSLSCISNPGNCQKSVPQNDSGSWDSVEFVQIRTDSLFNYTQIICLLKIRKKAFDTFYIEFGYSSNPGLLETNIFAARRDAAAAINRSYFDMDSSGSFTYFEICDSIISETSPSDIK